MKTIGFLFSAFGGGLLVFLTEELLQAARYSLPTIFISFVFGFFLVKVFRLRMPAAAALVIVGAVVAAVSAIVRVALVYGGIVSFLAGVDCFAMRGLTLLTYLLFGASGAVAGALISRIGRDRQGHEGPCILGIILGVLYHLKVAQGWWSGRAGVQQILFLGEFFAPTVFALVVVKAATKFGILKET